MEKQKRDLLPDVLRGFAILLVVLGHCIQEGSGQAFSEQTLYFSDRLYQFIYSFHMPLFMMLSGFYAWKSLQKAKTRQEQGNLLVKRSIHVLLPIVAWTTIDYIYKVGIGLYGTSGIGIIAKDYVISVLTNFWFLWAVFYSFLIIWVMHFWLKDSKLGYLLVFLAMFWTPDGLGLHAYKYMFPFYLLGCYMNPLITGQDVRQEREKQNQKKFPTGVQMGIHKCLYQYLQANFVRRMIFLVGTGIIFGLLFLLFDENSFIYLSGYKLYGKDYGQQLAIDGYRFLIGLVGSVFWILLWRELVAVCEKALKPLAVLGQLSLGIYVLSGYVIVYGVRVLTWQGEHSYVLNLVECIAVTLITAVITAGLKRIKGLRMLVG